MGAAAPAAGTHARPARPSGWWPVLVGTIVGHLRAVVLSLPLAIGLGLALGIDFNNWRAGAAWPFETDGAWSVVAGVVVALPFLVVATLCVRGSVQKRVPERVSGAWVFVALATA